MVEAIAEFFRENTKGVDCLNTSEPKVITEEMPVRFTFHDGPEGWPVNIRQHLWLVQSLAS